MEHELQNQHDYLMESTTYTMEFTAKILKLSQQIGLDLGAKSMRFQFSHYEDILTNIVCFAFFALSGRRDPLFSGHNNTQQDSKRTHYFGNKESFVDIGAI
jgi:hypothetical protein